MSKKWEEHTGKDRKACRSDPSDDLPESFFKNIEGPPEAIWCIDDVMPKKTVRIRLDTEIVEFFRSFGAGYQRRINAALRMVKTNYSHRVYGFGPTDQSATSAAEIREKKRLHAQKRQPRRP